MPLTQQQYDAVATAIFSAREDDNGYGKIAHLYRMNELAEQFAGIFDSDPKFRHAAFCSRSGRVE